LKSGGLFIVSAPSGAGKTTVLRQVLSGLAGLAFSVSHTTRKPRPGEEDGRDYHFVDHREFIRMREADAFLEWAAVHGNFYGTSRKAVMDLMDQGMDVILDIDVQGARQLQQLENLPAQYIFIAPPSWEELQRRLAGRGTETTESMRTRRDNARQEMAASDLYDYFIVNDSLDGAVEMLRSIILAERSRMRRTIAGQHIDLSRLVSHAPGR
jgi:guanylate kinase